ncbi:MAG: hypothetical protein QXL02_02740 [Candidatus Anstonellales archaeon]
MLRLLNDLVKIPTVTTREEIFISSILEILPDNALIVDKNIFIPGRSRFVFAAHYDTIGIVLEDYLSSEMYVVGKRGLIDVKRGYMFRTLSDNEDIIGIAADENTIHLIQPSEELPELQPFQYYPNIIITNTKIISPNLDNKLGVAVLLDLLRNYDIAILLLAGEEQGTTRLSRVRKHLEGRDIICVDSTSAINPHDERGIDRVSYRAVEGRGMGNIAPKDLVETIRKYISREAISYSIHQISDATTMFRYGLRAINISYPVRYLHSPMETADRNDIDELVELLINIIQDS